MTHQKTVDESDVEGEKEQDGLGDDHNEGPNQGVDQKFRERHLEQLLLSDHVLIAGFPPQLLRTPLQNNRGVRLGDGALEQRHGAGKDHLYPEDPPPADILADEATDDGAEDGATVRSGGEKRDCETTLFVVPDVGDGAASEGQRC